MAAAVDPSKRAASVPQDGKGSSPTKGASGSNPGVGDGSSSLSSAGEKTKAWVVHGATRGYSIIRTPFTFLFSIISYPFKLIGRMIWRKPEVAPQTIKVAVPGKLYGESIQDVSTSHALNKGWVTAEDAEKKHGVPKEYLTIGGWYTVEFDYENIGWGIRAPAIEHKKMQLRDALQNGWLTPREAIKLKFLTKDQAIAGKWTTAEELAKAEKAAEAKKLAKAADGSKTKGK